MTSSIPAFKAALLARLDAATATNVQVSWGHPHPKPMQRSLVIIGDTKDRTLQYVASMAAANERYTVDIEVSVEGTAAESQAVLLAAAYVIDDAVRADLLGAWKAADYGGVADVVVPGPGADSEAITPNGATRVASITTTVTVTKRV